MSCSEELIFGGNFKSVMGLDARKPPFLLESTEESKNH